MTIRFVTIFNLRSYLSSVSHLCQPSCLLSPYVPFLPSFIIRSVLMFEGFYPSLLPRYTILDHTNITISKVKSVCYLFIFTAEQIWIKFGREVDEIPDIAWPKPREVSYIKNLLRPLSNCVTDTLPSLAKCCNSNLGGVAIECTIECQVYWCKARPLKLRAASLFHVLFVCFLKWGTVPDLT